MLDRYAERRVEKLAEEHKRPHCEYCRKPVFDALTLEYIKTKRGAEMWYHTKCLQKEFEQKCGV